MTAKEKVLDYFEKWDGKGVNPANGFEIVTRHYDSWVFYEIWMDRVASYVYNRANDLSDRDVIVAARTLKLDTPKAAEIKWRDWEHVMYGQKRRSVCGEYSITRLFTGGAEAHFTKDQRHDLVARGASGMAEDKLYQACQDHKQKRLEALL